MHVLLSPLSIRQQSGMIFLPEQYKCSRRFFPHDISVVCLVTGPQERVTPSTASSGVGSRYCRIPMTSSRASRKTICPGPFAHTVGCSTKDLTPQ